LRGRRTVAALELGAGPPNLDTIEDLIQADDNLDGAPSRDTIARILGSEDVPSQQVDVIAIATVLAREARADIPQTQTRFAQLWVSARLARPVGQPISDVQDTPFLFEVHPAITVSAEAGATGVPVLPPYVPRTHDQHLRQVAEQVTAGSSEMVTLVGGSSTGKTRACWESLHHLPPGGGSGTPYDLTDPKPSSTSYPKSARAP
jgi:hypothetical protein